MPVKFVFVLCTVIEVRKRKERKAWTWFVHGDWHCDAWRGFWLREEVRYYLDKLVHWKLWKSLGDTWTVLRSFRTTWWPCMIALVELDSIYHISSFCLDTQQRKDHFELCPQDWSKNVKTEKTSSKASIRWPNPQQTRSTRSANRQDIRTNKESLKPRSLRKSPDGSLQVQTRPGGVCACLFCAGQSNCFQSPSFKGVRLWMR